MFYDGKAQARTADLLGTALVHPVKALENTILMDQRNTDTRIFHGETELAVLLKDPYSHLSLLLVILDGIIHQIVYNLFQNGFRGLKNKRLPDDLHLNLFPVGGLLKPVLCNLPRHPEDPRALFCTR